MFRLFLHNIATAREGVGLDYDPLPACPADYDYTIANNNTAAAEGAVGK